MNWYDFADKQDAEAHGFYQKLIAAKASGYDWTDTWVRVPRKLLHHLALSMDPTPSSLWTGFQWVCVFDYEADGRIFLRLPQHGEVSE